VNTAKFLAEVELPAEDKATLETEIDKSARKTIRVAALLPFIMAISFGLILIWFRTQGGYRAIHLTEE